MIINAIELSGDNSPSPILFSFRDAARQEPYHVKGITGLDADELFPQFYGVSGDTGEPFFNMSLRPRDVVIRMELNPGFDSNVSYSSLRDEIYKLISQTRSSQLHLTFYNAVGGDIVSVAQLDGFARKVEVDHFGKTPEVKLTLHCPYPMLRSTYPVEIDSPDGLNFFTIQDDLSTAPHGFSFTLLVTSDFPQLYIADSFDPAWHFQVDPLGGFEAGDVIYFSSKYNEKYLYLTRGVGNQQLADVISLDSTWPIIFPGENNFHFNPDESDLVMSGLSYYETYWGV